jgi:hypothetical protein
VAGVRPFLTALPGGAHPDFSVPNDAYFDYVDEIVRLAASRGILVLFTPAYLGYNGGAEGWYQAMLANGTARLTALGNYLGRRYATFPNIMWVDGGDYTPPDKTLTRAVANGIEAFAPNMLHTAHANNGVSAMDVWAGEPWLDVDTVYNNVGMTATQVYVKALREYQRPDWKPFFFIEGCYENGSCGNEVVIRQQAYEPMLNGAFGQIYGHGQLWWFASTWKSAMGSQGAFDMMRFRNLFAPRRWDLLVPRTDSSFLTQAPVSGALRASGACASDGTFGIVYTPDLRELYVNTERFTRPVTARWFDPTNGVFSAAAGAPLSPGVTRTFRPPGNNSRGKQDWVLVLE